MWTVPLVKKTLPGVTVRIGKNTYQGDVRGRFNRFATVSVTYADGRFGGSWEFAWETVVRALNKGVPLLV